MEKKLYRATVDRKILGVCAGIGRYLDVDPNVVRLVTVVLVFAAGLSLWVYLIAALLMPETPDF